MAAAPLDRYRSGIGVTLRLDFSKVSQKMGSWLCELDGLCSITCVGSDGAMYLSFVLSGTALAGSTPQRPDDEECRRLMRTRSTLYGCGVREACSEPFAV